MAVLVFVAGGLLASTILRFYATRFLGKGKFEQYECGESAGSGAWREFSVYFLKVAIVFAIFDAELIFVLPWIYVLENITFFLAMLIFFLILAVGLLWAILKKDIDYES